MGVTPLYFARARRARILSGFLLSIVLGVGLVLAGTSPAGAIPIRIVDDAGPDDEPGQKDLNELTVDFEPGGGVDLFVSWNWDVISVSGANTGDACALFDTDNDGNANFSLCVIWGDGADYETTRLYSCGDTRADRCTNPRSVIAQDNDGDGDLESLIGGPYSTTCSLFVVADTFGPRTQPQASATHDTQAICNVDLDDFGGTDAFLLNVCSYPSQVPGSDPSDCVITPNSGFLTIVKVAHPDDGTKFTFNLGAGEAANNGDTSFSTDGSGSVDLIGFPAGTTYDLTEVVPPGWELDSASCELSNGHSTGTASGKTVIDFEIQVGRETTCTFTNTKLGLLTLVKRVINDSGGTAPASAWTLTASGPTRFSGQSGVSASVAAGSYDLSESGPDGYSLTSLTCSNAQGQVTSVTLRLGEDVTCRFVNDDRAPRLRLVKRVINDNGGTAQPGDWTLSAVGYDPSNPRVGTYVLSETGPDGYSLTSLTCSNSGDAQVRSVTLRLGEDVTCRFVNDDRAPRLRLVKRVINDNGGTARPGDWTLSAVGYDPSNPRVGTYVLSETGPDGYSLTSLTCSNSGDAQVRSVTLRLGEQVTCTFVNDDDRPAVEPRTIGYWKNWSSCSGGRQDPVLDGLLDNPGFTIGVLDLGDKDCEDAVNILDKRSLDGRKRANDGAYNLAAQLLAAKLNLANGAETCQAAVRAVDAGQMLLSGIGFDGTGAYLRGRDAREANELADILDRYNNGDLCS